VDDFGAKPGFATLAVPLGRAMCFLKQTNTIFF